MAPETRGVDSDRRSPGTNQSRFVDPFRCVMLPVDSFDYAFVMRRAERPQNEIAQRRAGKTQPAP
jgi:hypothetical protein